LLVKVADKAKGSIDQRLGAKPPKKECLEYKYWHCHVIALFVIMGTFLSVYKTGY
jgi:hypothetical protein